MSTRNNQQEEKYACSNCSGFIIILAAMLAYDALASALAYCGFSVRRWKDSRLYLCGYGQDITAYLEAGSATGPAPADGWRLVVKSSWRAARYNGLRCKGVKHAILSDLFAAQLVSAPPPPSWQDIELDAAQAARAPIRTYAPKALALKTEAEVASASSLPVRHRHDPYATLRALHHADSVE